MYTAYVVVTVLTAAANIYAATVYFTRPAWLLDNMHKAGVPQSWLFSLGALKAAAALEYWRVLACLSFGWPPQPASGAPSAPVAAVPNATALSRRRCLSGARFYRSDVVLMSSER